MSADWKEYRLGDITEWASGGTPSKQNAEFWDGTIPWISASSMGSNRYNESNLKITQDGLKAGSRLAKKDSILLLVRGSTLHQRIPVGIATSDVSFNQDVKAITAKKDFIEPWYLLFWFMAKEKDLLNMVENTGIGAGKLDTKRLQDMLIKIPSDVERNRICRFAKALDDKLLLNRQINQTLESMAQA
ncbi:MAG TPA: restriction endonuclease subunit S, partial [Anaerovoracaceae bacterium]|nr:restriction endonuclease subunit S [Anaerovoracaceae bacterium]